MSRWNLPEPMFNPDGDWPRGAKFALLVASTGEVASRGPSAKLHDAAGARDRLTATAADPWRLSHELRTPLNAILGNVELLLDGSAGPISHEARTCLGDVQAAGRRLMREVQDLLLLAQLRDRAGPVEDQQLDLLALLREAHARSWPAGTAPALHIMPANVRLMVRGAPGELAALAVALIDLPSTGPQSPAELPRALSLRLEHHAAGRRLAMTWAAFDGALVSSIRAALIVRLLELHGAKMGLLDAGGVWLEWPKAGL